MGKVIRNLFIMLLPFAVILFSCRHIQAEGHIAYSFVEGGSANIALMDVATSETTLVTSFRSNDPGLIKNIIPDAEGGRIIFTRESPLNGNNLPRAWIVNTDGSGLADLIDGNHDIQYRYAAISPDGSKIAYARNFLDENNLPAGTYDLYVRNIDGVQETKLTALFTPDYEIRYPVFISNTSILFLASRGALHDYYRVNTDGTGLTNLTNNIALSPPHFPVLGRPSLNEARTSFIYGQRSYENGGHSDWRIHTRGVAPGSASQLVLDNLYYEPGDEARDPHPFFAGGAEIGFIGTQGGGVFNIYLTLQNALNPYMIQATHDAEDPYVPCFFSVEPVDTRFVYEHDGRIYIRDIYSANPVNIGPGTSPSFDARGVFIAYAGQGINLQRAGHAQVRKIDDAADAAYPVFSPCGRWIIYIKNGQDIYARYIPDEQQAPVLLHSSQHDKRHLAFSPDGKNIAYTVFDGTKRQIYALQVTSISDAGIVKGGEINLTPLSHDNYQPDFCPEGRNMLFISERNQNKELWIMNSDGSGQRKIFFSAAPNNPAYPRFHPEDSHIAGFFAGAPPAFHIADISGAVASLLKLSPVLIADGRAYWSVSPAETIDARREILNDIVFPDITDFEYTLRVNIDTRVLPNSFILTESIPAGWVLRNNSIVLNGSQLDVSGLILSGGPGAVMDTLRLIFGPGGVAPVGDLAIKLELEDISVSAVGDIYWLTGGAKVSGRTYLTRGDARIMTGQPFIPVDTNRDWKISDSELLVAIDMWANNLQIKNWPDIAEWDNIILDIIGFWSASGYEYVPGQGEPHWQAKP